MRARSLADDWDEGELTSQEAVQLYQELQVDIVTLWRLAVSAAYMMCVQVDTCIFLMVSLCSGMLFALQPFGMEDATQKTKVFHLHTKARDGLHRCCAETESLYSHIRTEMYGNIPIVAVVEEVVELRRCLSLGMELKFEW